MKIFSILAFALSASRVAGQETFAECPANITDATSCEEACGDFTVDFVVLAAPFRTRDDSAYNFAGFNCECAEAEPPVQCTFTYEFPTCLDVGVTDCSEPPTTCGSYCSSLGFNADEGALCERDEVTSPPWTSCMCAAPFVVDDGTTPGSEMYVCGDSGYELGPSATLSYCPRVIVISTVAVVIAIIAQTQ